MTWLYQDNEIDQLPEDCVGFVYIITNLANKRMYVGKKLAKFKKTRYKMHTQKNGVKKKKKIREHVDSDWKTYYGSSKELNADIELIGEENFRREILFFCKSKAECTYREAEQQFSRKVLETDDYYNGQIHCRIHQSHILKS